MFIAHEKKLRLPLNIPFIEQPHSAFNVKILSYHSGSFSKQSDVSCGEVILILNKKLLPIIQFVAVEL